MSVAGVARPARDVTGALILAIAVALLATGIACLIVAAHAILRPPPPPPAPKPKHALFVAATTPAVSGWCGTMGV